jgi:DivIVA domain-containing protein
MSRRKEKKDKANTEDAQRDRITPVDIQKKEFRVAMRGYHEQDVDQFLDDVTEEVARLYAENKRLREELEFLGTRKLDAGAAGEAEALLRRAQEEADRILAAARTRGPDPARRSGTPGPLGPFISREREFLQSLAELIQSHAEAVKEELRRAREASDSEPDVPSTPAEPDPAEAGKDSESGETPYSAGSDPPTQAWTVQDQSEDQPERSAEPKIEGQDWTRYYSEPDGGTAAIAASKNDDILDLTGASHQEFVGTHSAEASPLDDQDAEDRSLRELFWGED